MTSIGILAYGSLLEDPGAELDPLISSTIPSVLTPFKVEFARTSTGRDGAPTLVPVDQGGAQVRGTILVLCAGVSESDAADMLWRREVNRVGRGGGYVAREQPGLNKVVIEPWLNFHGVDVVLTTRIAANIPDRSPQALAALAIRSAQGAARAAGRDGISYLMAVKQHGIRTPLMDAYEAEILRQTEAQTLEDARERCRQQQG